MLRSKLCAMTMLCVSAFSLIGCGGPDSDARNAPSGAKSGDKGVQDCAIAPAGATGRFEAPRFVRTEFKMYG